MLAAKRHLLLAGGIGVTPMMAMIEELESSESRLCYALLHALAGKNCILLSDLRPKAEGNKKFIFITMAVI